MKKFLSVLFIVVALVSVFSMSASAIELNLGVLVDDVYYFAYENVAIVTGFDMDADDTSPKPGIVIPEEITYKGNKYKVMAVIDQAFYMCDYTSITLPSTIVYIGNGAFMSSPYLEEVDIPDTCEFMAFGDDVFIGTPFEAEIYSKDETIFGKNVLFSYTGNADEYTIPDDIEIIAPKCFFMSGVKNVVFNKKVTEIPDYAFMSCRNLTDVTISDEIISIGEGAFKDCTSLENVTLGANVASLGIDCFSNTNIKEMYLGQSVYDIAGAFKDCKTLENITVDVANTVLVKDGDGIYHKTTFYFDGEEREGLILVYYLPSAAQGTVTLKPNVGAIGPYAFYGCKELDEVVANELEYIGDYAFCNSSIKKFSAKGNYYIWDSAFRNCKNLETINLENVDSIGISAFENCTALKDVTFSKDIYYISELAFANTGITDVVISSSDYCYIFEAAFKGCKELESVRLENGVEYVGMNAFLDCPKLKTIYLSKTVSSFEDNAFNGCDNVTFELVKNSRAYKYIKNYTDFNFEIVGKLSFFERIIEFFRSLFGF